MTQYFYIGIDTHTIYKIVEKIDHIGMSEVFIVQDKDTPNGELFVLKISKADPNQTKDFKREIQNNKSLKSFGIERDGLISFKEEIEPLKDGRLGFIMEYIQHGCVLDTWVREQKSMLSSQEFVHFSWRLLWRLSRFITAFHETSFLHNDIKPSNIFVSKQYNNTQLYLLDLGIARHHSTPMNGTGGTPHFSAPECLNSALNDGDQSSDIYSVVQTWIQMTFDEFIDPLTKLDSIYMNKDLAILLSDALKEQSRRSHRSSKDFLNALTKILLEISPICDIDQITTHFDREFIGWTFCPLSGLYLPKRLDEPIPRPIFFASRYGIHLEYMKDIEVKIEWGVPTTHNQLKPEHFRLSPGHQPLRWKFQQVGAYVDIYPINKSHPSQRLFFPQEISSPANIQTHLTNAGRTLYQFSIVGTIHISEVELFEYSTIGVYKHLSHTNGFLHTSVTINNRDCLYLFWEKTTQRMLDIQTYSMYQLHSILADPLVQRRLSEFTQQLTGRSALQFASLTFPLMTSKAKGRIDNLHTYLTPHILSAESKQFRDETSAVIKEFYGVLTKLEHFSSIKINSKRQWTYLARYCTAYNITTDKFWLLLFFIEKCPLWPLYSGPAVPFPTPLSLTATDFIEFSNTQTLMHTLKRGSLPPMFQFVHQNKASRTQVHFFEGEHIKVGRWDTKSPPHLPLTLSPYMPSQYLIIRKNGDVQVIDPSLKDLCAIYDDTISISDGLFARRCTNPKCNLLQSHKRNRCLIHKCNASLNHSSQPAHILHLQVSDNDSAVVCTSENLAIPLAVALNAYPIDSDTTLFLERNQLMISSHEHSIEIQTTTSILLYDPQLPHPVPANTIMISTKSSQLDFM